jgi:GNAT superfamily N-acetyltransferase
VGSSTPRVERDPDRLLWRAVSAGEEVGTIRTVVRPDKRRFVRFGTGRLNAFEPLLAAVARDVTGELYATVDEADDDTRRRYEALGFVVDRRESHYLIPTDPDATGLGGVAFPPGYSAVTADAVDLGRLRRLDDVLRQDVPGTAGWRWDEEGFRCELQPPDYDPATYLVALAGARREHVGIVRVWNNAGGPRLGFVGVHREHRRRGLAKALVARVFAVLHERGEAEVTTEIDDENVASRSLLEPLGARRTGGSVELVRRSLEPL